MSSDEEDQSNDNIDIKESELQNDEINTQLNINENINDNNFSSQLYNIILDDNGYPNIKKGEIYCVDVNTEITIKVNSNSKLNNEINIISNCNNDFPNLNFIDELKLYINDNLKKENLSEKEIPFDKIEKNKISPNNIKDNFINFKINLKKPGTFIFMILYNSKELNKYKLLNPFYILVNPIIDLGKDEKTGNIIKIPLNKIQLQSVLSKNLGKLSNFENYYKELSLLKYNFIHLTSIQTLSSSENLFCIKEQNEISDLFFEEKEKLSKEEKILKFKENMSLLRTNYHIGSIIDIVLNQTSIESNWIYENPECGYTLDNCPWLTVAYELDKLLVNYSNLFFDKKVCQSAPYLNNEEDLKEVIEEMRKRVLRENFEEFFLIQIEDYISKFQEFYQNLEKDQSYGIKRNYLFNELEKNFNIQTNEEGRLILNDETLYDLISFNCTNHGESRFGIKVNVEFVSMLLLESYRDIKNNSYPNEFNFLKEAKKFINKINEYWTEKVSEMLKIALLNVKEFIRYEFIELKRTGIRRKLVDNYFHVIDPNDKKKIFLCNGFIMQSEDPKNPFPDYTKEGTWYLFKRKVIVWNDSLKLNYGENIEKTPKFLMEYLSNYINDMAKIFDGLYIDNIIALPKFILRYFIHEARKINENLIIITQLPENNNEIESEYINDCGINLFAKEMIWCSNPIEIISNISNFSKIKQKQNNNNNDNTINTNVLNNQINILKPQNPPTLLYDISLDNQSFYEQYNNLSLNLSIMACIGLLNCAIGSTRGYDQLFPFQPSVVKENRNYIFDKNFENLLEDIKRRLQQANKIKEIFFEFHPRNSENPNTKTVKLALSSHGWKPDIPLTRINDNLFTVRLKLPQGKYHYRYLLDGNIWTYDSSQPMEFDVNKRIINVLDLTTDTKILSSDIKLLRRDINLIRNSLRNSKTEVYVQNDKDLICVIRMIIDGKKIKLSIDSSSSKSSYDIGDRDYNRNIDNFYSMDQLSLAESYKKNLQNEIYDENIIYEGYAIICRPGYDKNDGNSINAKIIIPGEISDFICGCYMNVDDFEINDFLGDDILKGVKGNVYYSKDAKFLSSISNVIFQGGNTLIDFHSILPNTVIILKVSCGKNNLNSYY